MELCSEGHDEICYEVKNCPACSLLEDIKILEDENERLEKEADES